MVEEFMTWHIFEWYGLFVWCFRPTREIFIHLKTSPLMMKGWIFWHLLVTHSNERYLTAIPTATRANVLLPSVWQWICHFLLQRLTSVPTGDRTPIFRMRGESPTSTPLRRSNNMMWHGVFERDKFEITVKYLSHYICIF